MNGFFKKIARFAVSKMAAFGYAVAVGVAGNLAFHFVQTQAPIPVVLTASPETSRTGQEQAGTPAATAITASKPAVAPIPEPAAAAPSATVSVSPAVRPASSKPTPALQLPEPPAANLPQPAALSAPAWKPLQRPGAPAPSEAAAKPVGAPSGEASNPAPVGSLPPLGPAVEVAQRVLPQALHTLPQRENAAEKPPARNPPAQNQAVQNAAAQKPGPAALPRARKESAS